MSNEEAIRVDGYASAPEREPNRLAEERASAVKRVLVQFGVDEARIAVATHGARLPVASEGDVDGRAKIRRVDFEAGRISAGDNCGPIVHGGPRF